MCFTPFCYVSYLSLSLSLSLFPPPSLSFPPFLPLPTVLLRLFSKDLGARIRELQSGHSVSISDVTVSNEGSARYLDCDEVCAQEERNKKLAAALEIDSPNVSSTDSEAGQYSLFLLEQARYNWFTLYNVNVQCVVTNYVYVCSISKYGIYMYMYKFIILDCTCITLFKQGEGSYTCTMCCNDLHVIVHVHVKLHNSSLLHVFPCTLCSSSKVKVHLHACTYKTCVCDELIHNML